jgi:hypothetical protein
MGTSAGIDYTTGHYPMVAPIDAKAHYYDCRLWGGPLPTFELG